MSRAWRIVLGLCLVLSAALLSPPSAVEGRTDGPNDRTLFIHGVSGANCESDWGFLIDNMRAANFTGGFYVLKFTSGDSNCNARSGTVMGCMYCFGSHASHYGHTGTTHTNNTSIRHLAWHLAHYISANWSSKGISVDVVAHSMGGLLIRYALAMQGSSGFPTLLVEDVITLGTPHAGQYFSGWQGHLNGDEMEPGSTLISWLSSNAQNPQGAGGTDWTVLGSVSDIVDETSATAKQAAHRWRYGTYPQSAPPVTHAAYMKLSSTDLRQAQRPCGTGWCVENTYYPVQMIRRAMYYGSW